MTKVLGATPRNFLGGCLFAPRSKDGIMEDIFHNVSRSEPISDDIRGRSAQLLSEARSALAASPAEAECCIRLAATILSRTRKILP